MFKKRIALLSLPLSVVLGCNRTEPRPERVGQEGYVQNHQAATPAGGGGATGGPESMMAAASGAPGASMNGDTAANAGGTAALDDAQIARITHDSHDAEVVQGKLARGKAKDARVKQFAERMVKHHTEAMDKQAKLKLESSPSDLSRQMEQSADATLSELKTASDASFDAVYIAAQVKEHQQVLDSIDQKFLPNAKSDALKSYLKEVRPTVEAHLKEARELQAKLNQQDAKLNQPGSKNQKDAKLNSQGDMPNQQDAKSNQQQANSNGQPVTR